MSDMDPNFEDRDSCYEDDEDESCWYGEGCVIADAQDELALAKRHKFIFHVKRLFSKKFQNWLDDVYTWIGLAGTEHCQFTCPLRGLWLGKEGDC